MSSNERLRPKDEPTGAVSRSLSRIGRRSESTAIPTEKKGPVTIGCPGKVYCIAILTDGKHVVSGDDGWKIRCWRVDDGDEVGASMDTGSRVRSIAVSPDGRWIVSGAASGRVQIWNMNTRDKVREIQAHSECVFALDVSLGGTKIASGSDDKTVCVWSLSTGDRLLGPWTHDNGLAAAKFSSDGRLVATATWEHESVRVYDVQDGHHLFNIAIKVSSFQNNSLAWSSDSNQLFVLSRDGTIHSLDAFAGTTLSKWPIHNSKGNWCIALASNGDVIAASAGSSLSFWDTATQEQVGSVVRVSHWVGFLAIADSHVLATGGDQAITLRNLKDILPSSYLTPDIGHNSALLETVVEGLHRELAKAQLAAEEKDELLHSQEVRANDEIAQLKESNEKLRDDLAVSSSQIALDQEKYEEETRALQLQIELWESSYAAQGSELTTARETVEELRRNQSQSVQLPPSSQTGYEMRSNVHYGVACALPVDTDNEEHIRRRDLWEMDPTGKFYVPGYFESKIRVGTGPPEEREFRDAFSLISNDPADFTGRTVRIACYRGTLSDPKWLDEDEESFLVLCTIHVDLSDATRDLVMVSAESEEVHYKLDYDLIVSFGRTEIRAEVCWISRTGERRAPARITFED